MAIRFRCQCGKSLKAREESAGKRTKCPQCGMPVGIPSLEPTHRGIVSSYAAPRRSSLRPSHSSNGRDTTTGPATNQESRHLAPAVDKSDAPQSRRNRRKAGCKSLPVNEPAEDHIEIRPRRQPKWVRLCGPRGRRTAITNISSHEPAISFIGFVAVATAACAVVIRLLPLAVQDGWLIWPHGPITMGASVVLAAAIGFYCHCLGQVFKTTLKGKRQDYSFEVRLEDTFVTLGKSVVLFVAGPILPATIALDYWIRCGAATPFDWLVLVGLTSVAIGYGTGLLISANTGRGLLSFSPKNVLVCCEQLGPSGIVGSALLALLLLALIKLTTVAAAWIHNDEVSGYLLLGVGFVAGSLLSALLLRRMGEQYHRAAMRRPLDSPGVSSITPIVTR